MKGLKVSALLGALIGLAFLSPARAQTPTTGLSIEVGGDYALDSDVRDVTGDWGWRAGLGYKLPTPSFLAPKTGGRSSVDLTYSENKGGNAKLTVWSLTYAERVPFSATMSTGMSPYWGLALGVARNKAEVTVPVGEGTSTFDETKTRIAGRFLLGLDFSKNMYVEASYNLTGKVMDVDTNSLGLVAGVRF